MTQILALHLAGMAGWIEFHFLFDKYPKIYFSFMAAGCCTKN